MVISRLALANRPVLGGCVGHNCRIGSGMIIFPARTIESDVVLFASAERRVIDRDILYEDSDHHKLQFSHLHPRLYPRPGEGLRGIMVRKDRVNQGKTRKTGEVRMNKAKLLIVEDDLDLSNMLKIFFSSQNYQVETALRGSEALEITRHNLPHLIILDIMLPDMDGFRSLPHLAHSHAHQPCPHHLPNPKR